MLGSAIAKRRGALGLTQEHVAHEAGLSVRYYIDCEGGSRKVSLEVAARIAAALDWRLQELLDSADSLG